MPADAQGPQGGLRDAQVRRQGRYFIGRATLGLIEGPLRLPPSVAYAGHAFLVPVDRQYDLCQEQACEWPCVRVLSRQQPSLIGGRLLSL